MTRFFAALFALFTFSAFAPVAAQVTVVGSLVQEQNANPGSAYDGLVSLRNEGATPARVRVYLTDYRFAADGRSEFAEAGTSVRSNAKWVTLGTNSIVIAPHQTSSVTYKVQVPGAASGDVSGSFWSVAMFEVERDAPPQTKRGSVDITTVIRQGVQLVTHAGSKGAAIVSFSNLAIARDSTGPSIQFDAGNDGSRARRLLLSVDLYSETGELVARLTKQRGIVYPGCSIRQLFSLASLRKGSYTAFIVADAGDDDLFAGNFRFVL